MSLVIRFVTRSGSYLLGLGVYDSLLTNTAKVAIVSILTRDKVPIHCLWWYIGGFQCIYTGIRVKVDTAPPGCNKTVWAVITAKTPVIRSSVITDPPLVLDKED
jgi:hypothetical protein